MKRKMNWGTLGDVWLMSATAFTVAALCLALISGEDLSFQLLGSLFLMCFCVSLAMVLFDRFTGFLEARLSPKLMTVVDALLRCVTVLLIVYVVGGALDCFPWGWSTLWMLMPTVVVTFAVTYAAYFIRYAIANWEARAINERIKKRG